MNKGKVIIVIILLSLVGLLTTPGTFNVLGSATRMKHTITANTPYIEGPTHCIIGNEYDYTFRYIHPLRHDIFFRIYWGDCMAYYRVGPYRSGERVTLSHTWCKLCCEAGMTTIFALATDEFGFRSDIASFEIYLSYGINNQNFYPTIC